jgi:Ca2+-binding EF-hand superfamily protein
MTMLNATSTQRPGKEQMFSKVDADGGGTIDKVELSDFAKELSEKTGVEIDAEEALTTYDADGDGGLSQEEMDTMMKAEMPPPPAPMGGGMQAMGMAPPSSEEMFGEIDTDGSGAIDETELTAFAEKLAEDTGFELNLDDAIASYDEDGDSALSQEEMDTMMKAEMPPPPPMPEQALAAYGQNSGEDDLLNTLLSMLSSNTDSDEESVYSALNIKG